MMKAKRSGSLLWLALSVLGAVICAILRRWQLYTSFEGDLRLPIPMALPSVLLVVFYILCAAALFLLARRYTADHPLKETPELALHAKDSNLFMGALLCSALLHLVTAPMLFLRGRQLWTVYKAALEAARAHGGNIPGGNNGILTLATAVASLLSFVALLVVCKGSYRGTAKGRLAILLPAINGCLWLMDTYRSHAANPVLWDYAPLLLSIAFGLLMFLEWAGLYAGLFIPRRALWMAGMTVVFSATALTGEWTLSSAMLLCAQTIAALAILWRIPLNLRYPPEVPTGEIQAEEKLEEETHE